MAVPWRKVAAYFGLADPPPSAPRDGPQVRRTPYHCGFCKEQGYPVAREADVSGETVTVYYCASCKAILSVYR